MSYLIASFIVLWILYSISDHIGNGDCRSTTGFESDLEWLCERCNVITLTWGFMQGHATGDSGDRIVIKKAFPECIAIAGRHGFIPATNNDNMVTLVRTNKKDFTQIHKENAKRAEEKKINEEILRQAEEELNNNNAENNHKGFVGVLIGLAVVVGFIYFLGVSISPIRDKIEYKYLSNSEPSEDIYIPTDSSVYKRTNPNFEEGFGTSSKSKTITKENEESYSYYDDNDVIEDEEIEEEIENTIDENKIYDVVEEMPQFPGGSAALFDYLNKNIRYPIVAQENGVQGRVVTTFVVECDGSITDVEIVRSVDPSLDIEAKRIVRSMPSWIPAKQNGKRVRAKYTVPITFRLSNDIAIKTENATDNDNIEEKYAIKNDIRLMNKMHRNKEKRKYVDDMYI